MYERGKLAILFWSKFLFSESFEFNGYFSKLFNIFSLPLFFIIFSFESLYFSKEINFDKFFNFSKIFGSISLLINSIFEVTFILNSLKPKLL